MKCNYIKKKKKYASAFICIYLTWQWLSMKCLIVRRNSCLSTHLQPSRPGVSITFPQSSNVTRRQEPHRPTRTKWKRKQVAEVLLLTGQTHNSYESREITAPYLFDGRRCALIWAEGPQENEGGSRRNTSSCGRENGASLTLLHGEFF